MAYGMSYGTKDMEKDRWILDDMGHYHRQELPQRTEAGMGMRIGE